MQRVGLPWEGASILARFGSLVADGELFSAWPERHQAGRSLAVVESHAFEFL